ncbi:MAG: cellulase family glycosylhydrolase [Bacteroidales bacterium]|nr:cellulase family glycosylhydrolase [Bacteroidales bacterium]
MKRLLFFLSLGIFLVSCQSQKGSGIDGFKIKRGTNISHWLSQSKARGADRVAFFTEEDVKRLASYGFDHLRIPVDEEQLWNEAGEKEAEAFQLLHNGIQWCIKYNLRVIVDLHIIRSHHFNAGNDGGKNTLFEDEKEQDKLIGLWDQLSEELKQYSTDFVAYEFMNEPVAPDHEQWNQLIVKMHKALRAREPKRVLVIGSNMWQGVGTFQYLKVPQGDRNIILSFHFYEPFLLTHYKTSWTNLKGYQGWVHYPGLMVTPEEFEQLSPEDKELAQSWRVEWNRDSLISLMSEAIRVAKENNLQLFCGEWGVTHDAPQQDAWNWYRDMISIFDEYNIAWTTWSYKSSFGFKNYDGTLYDQTLLDILMAAKPVNAE